MHLANILESLMMFTFGCAWPASILKSWRARSAKGKSLAFLLLILAGYTCGMAAKVLTGQINFVLYFYAANFVMVFADFLLYLRNRRLDAQARQSFE